jgi:hypothetical protein
MAYFLSHFLGCRATSVPSGPGDRPWVRPLFRPLRLAVPTLCMTRGCPVLLSAGLSGIRPPLCRAVQPAVVRTATAAAGLAWASAAECSASGDLVRPGSVRRTLTGLACLRARRLIPPWRCAASISGPPPCWRWRSGGPHRRPRCLHHPPLIMMCAWGVPGNNWCGRGRKAEFSESILSI